MKRHIASTLPVIVFLAGLVVSSAVGPEGLQASADGWVGIGPSGGNVSAVAIDPQTPNTVYAGTSSGGVFKSINGGRSWTAVNSGLTNLDVRVLAIDPHHPATLYTGTAGIGRLFKSVNGGESWSPTGLSVQLGWITTI